MMMLRRIVSLLLLVTLGYCIPIDNGIVSDPLIECGPTSIKVTFDTENNWEGKLYTKNFFVEEDCLVSGTGNGRSASIEIPFDTCGSLRQRSLTPRGVFVHATVIMSFHPVFITKVDRAVRLQCFYMEADKTVSTDIEVSPITSEFATQNVPMPICRYEILDAPNGQPIQFALVGQAVYHKWTCDTETTDTFCMTVYGCYVDDGTLQDTIQLLDEQGCAYDKYLLGNVEYPTDLMAIKEAHVFKYADRANLYFNCQINIVIKEPNGQCVRESCQEPRGFASSGNVQSPPSRSSSSRNTPNGRFSSSNNRNNFRGKRDVKHVPGLLGTMDIEPDHSIVVGELNLSENDLSRALLPSVSHTRVISHVTPQRPGDVCLTAMNLSVLVVLVALSFITAAIIIGFLVRRRNF